MEEGAPVDWKYNILYKQKYNILYKQKYNILYKQKYNVKITKGQKSMNYMIKDIQQL